MTLRIRGRRFRTPQLLALALASVLVVTIILAATTSGTAFGAYNTAWDGGRDLRLLADDHAETVFAQNTTTYDTQPPEATVAFILAPDSQYDARDTARVEQFVRNGGTLVVADDIGPHTNRLLAAIGVETRLAGAILRDEREFYRSPAMPVADNVSEHPITVNVSRVTLNHATAVIPGSDARVLVRTSEFAYLDTTANSELDDNETLQRYPVAAVEQLGDGRVVVLGDPSIFINRMLGQSDNRQLARNLVTLRSVVVFDYSHTAALPPLAAVLVAVRQSMLLQAAIAGLLALTLLGWSRSTPVETLRNWATRRDAEPGDSRGLSREERVAVLAAKHPDLDDDRIERITEAFINERAERQPDGRPRRGTRRRRRRSRIRGGWER